ncbi:MAG TPA: chlorohydrolase family protein [Burkholderiales bacterium]|nr:chlorohydrolase family protein [Burkholderiales bacterium]
MRTRISGGWVVGHRDGRHRLDQNHEVVFDGDDILYVGPKFEGRVDKEIDAKDKLVAPGFIDTHVHSGHRASHRLITDAGRGDYFGQPFFEISVPKEGTRIDGDVRYLRPDETGREGEMELHALFTVAELLRNGVTTFVEYGSQLRIQEALMTQCLALGVRGYLGPGYDSGRWVGDEHGRLKRVLNEENGRREFAGALKWIEKHDGAGKGLIKGILVPREMETCSIDLLRMTREKADEMKLPMATHAAYSIIEFYEVVREHRKTPIEILADLGMLRPTLNIGHGNLPADSVRLNYPAAQDLKLMGEAGVSISHCAINIVRRARVLDNWRRYTELGINIALGSDTYPRDMMLNMRTASYHGKVMSHDYKSATAADVFSAATLNGAKSLGRDDLGRLQPGARADIIVIDLSGKGTLRMGPVRDPVRTVVECGVGDDVDTVIVAGEVRMQNGRIPGVDLDQVRKRAQEASERIWANWHTSDPLGREADEICPASFCPASFRDGELE